MRTKLLWLVVLLGLPIYPAHAANPELLALVDGIDDDETRSEAIELAELHLEIEVVGALADVAMTARFFNPSDDTLEGDFSLLLPAGAVVTGYALDVQEAMLDGVLVDPLKAQRAYQGLVREGIDPGIARVSRDDVFNTRVFPIPERDSRTIRIRFSAPVPPGKGLSMPLSTGKALESFTLSLRACGQRQRPVLTLPRGVTARWSRSGDCATATAKLAQRPLSGVLAVVTSPSHAALAFTHRNGARFVHIQDRARFLTEPHEKGRRLRVYWDHSRSRRDHALAREQALLAGYVSRTSPSRIDLVSFNSSKAESREMTAQELGASLGRLRYRGATSFAGLDQIELAPADTCLVFSDGLVTLGARPDFTPTCDVVAITSSPAADMGFLRRLAGPSGTVLDLASLSDSEASARIRRRGPQVLAAFDEAGRELAFAILPSPERTWSVIVESPAVGAVTLRIRGLAGEPVLRTYSPVGERIEGFDAAGALWANDRASSIAARDGEHEAFVALARRFSIAAPGLSFLVLENPGDYIEVDVTPPESYPRDLRAEYDELMAEIARSRAVSREEHIEALAVEWNALLAWWNTAFDPAAPANVRATPRGGERGSELDEVIVTGLRGSAPAMNEALQTVIIDMAEWEVSRPYVAALDAALPGDLEAVLATQERRYGALPMFHFDVAEWLHRRQRRDDAIETLLSALDLPAANEETEVMIAERLMRYGEYDIALWLLERVASRSDYLPQPRRLLAMALVRRAAVRDDAGARADLARAVALLNEVAMSQWGGEFDGIQLVALVEANALLPRLEAAGVGEIPVDPRLRARLDFDIRVVIEWNTGSTDMDLWVDEPNGERAIYDNPLTAIGGRLSNDMQRGYGPEEYLLRRAALGEYRISVNSFATDVINPNGSTVVKARLFRDFGRPSQIEQTLEIELEPGEDSEKLIGRFTVK